MRRASLYIGLLLLITAGPFALATWALEVVSIHRTARQMPAIIDSTINGWFDLLRVVAIAGLLVAVIESRGMASAILGARFVGRPIMVAKLWRDRGWPSGASSSARSSSVSRFLPSRACSAPSRPRCLARGPTPRS